MAKQVMYSERWSSELFDKFSARLSRATIKTCKILGLSRAQVVFWIRINDKKWAAFKKTVKFTESQLQRTDIDTLLSTFEQSVEYSVCDFFNEVTKPRLTGGPAQGTLFECGLV